MSTRTVCSCDVRGCKRQATVRVVVNDTPIPALCPTVFDVCDDCSKKRTLDELISDTKDES